jgi:MFS family permease
MALEDQPVGEVTLLVLLIQSSLLALMLIIAPLLVRKRAGLQGRGALKLLLYFFCLGLGFILCEIGAIQRLTLFLGQPVYTFAVVVGSLLVASGIGSLLSTKVADRVDRIPGRLRLMLVATSLVILLFALLSPSLLEACLGLPFALRVVIAAVILIPLGLCMGMAFPLGIRFAGAVLPSMIPWAWGLNAVASVVGSVAAMVLATMVGFSGVFIIAAAIYALAMLSTLAWSGQQHLAPGEPLP